MCTYVHQKFALEHSDRPGYRDLPADAATATAVIACALRLRIVCGDAIVCVVSEASSVSLEELLANHVRPAMASQAAFLRLRAAENS